MSAAVQGYALASTFPKKRPIMSWPYRSSHFTLPGQPKDLHPSRGGVDTCMHEDKRSVDPCTVSSDVAVLE